MAVDAKNPPAKRLKVLVVDDSTDSAKMLAMVLKISGHDSKTAFDGPQALEAVGSFAPEVIFLDIGLPIMNGYEVARKIREIPGQEGVVLVAMTGFDEDEHRRQATEAGFNHYLVKPADPRSISEILAKQTTSGV